MKRFYKILRALAVTLTVLLFVIPATFYVGLSLPVVQRYICHRAEKELSAWLAVPVSVERLSITPFNSVALYGVDVKDLNGKSAMKASRLGAGVNLWEYFAHGRIVIDYAEIIGMDVRIYRDSVGAPLNIQPIIDAVSPKDRKKPPAKFDFRINTVVLRTSSVTYDVLSDSSRQSGFDPNHISVTGLRADVQFPRIKNDDFKIDLRRLAFNERSGLSVNSLCGMFHVSSEELSAKSVEIAMPRSRFLLSDQTFRINGLSNLGEQLKHSHFDFAFRPGSYVTSSDFVAFVPQLESLDMRLDINIHAVGSLSDIRLQTLELTSGQDVKVTAYGRICGISSPEGVAIDIPQIDAGLNMPRALDAALRFARFDASTERILRNMGNVAMVAAVSADRWSGNVKSSLAASGVDMDFDADFTRSSISAGSPVKVKGLLSVNSFDGSRVFAGVNNPLFGLTSLDGDMTVDMTVGKGIPDGSADVDIHSATFNGQAFSELTVSLYKKGSDYEGQVFVDNPMLYANADVRAKVTHSAKSLDFTSDIRNLNLSMFGIDSSSPAKYLSLAADGSFNGTSVDDVSGALTVEHIQMTQEGMPDFEMRDIFVESVRGEDIDSLTVRSDVADAVVRGKYHLSTLIPVGKAILAQTMPALAGSAPYSGRDEFWTEPRNYNELTYHITLKTIEPLAPLVKSPVGVIHPVEIAGDFRSLSRSFSLRLDAPYLTQGNKLIQNTSLTMGVCGPDSIVPSSNGNISFATTLPTKKGPMAINTNASANNDRVDTHFEWRVDRERDFSGDLNFSAQFARTDEHGLRTDLFINPGRMVFNDTVWTVDPAKITVEGKVIEVDDFRCWRDKQHISMSGRASELPSDTITLALENVNLDYIFETLDIQTAMFGGNATGKFYATQLLTPTPIAFTPGLNVAGLTYNHSLMGNALIKSQWLNDSKAVSIFADILQPNGCRSQVDGCIYPMDESLDLSFTADKLEIGFLKPYMSAFASNVSGYASGKARLYGTFKLIDMIGDVYGEDVKLTLGFTNTTYSATDSVHFTPGRINLDNLLLKDMYGNTARLNGWVTHKCFKSPEFDFRISDARNLLVYDVKENSEFQWYGRVFGNGSARVEGVPGLVDIRVSMSTAPNSTFTYVLSDALSAQDYRFITFRDRDQAKKDSIAELNAPPLLVRQFNERILNAGQDSNPSKYKMTFNIDITPQALITLVMDPVGGDRIRCHGSGNLSMAYDSANEDLRMNGTYVLDDGKYNFTLQDIIIKEFTIQPGSSIAFNGDPYAAQLNMTAKYQVKANLTDLDESFLEDKELNRTNVPVDALLHVNGDMRQPEISFNLDFPTLTEETKRKVNSIVNTDEMMSRQIIYLLALNRFYTPDYMNATRGNEFVSVASSTISSQLSNILGQLSDNWNIAPNIRSDRGDFSDVEFDVALSSSLLNNRLLLNGNLGYRDKSLNNNSFIGDFDIEYLLNRSGSFRLKAYNRYNDQNYYLKSALTTQGVGIVLKRDFDNLFSFLRPWLRKRHDGKAQPTSSSSDTIPADSTHVAVGLPD